MAALDQILAVAIKGYAWLPDLRRRAGGRPVVTRVTGRRAVGIEGPHATRFFYGEGNLERHPALPHPVVSTLFGKDAVHTLDGAAHPACRWPTGRCRRWPPTWWPWWTGSPPPGPGTGGRCGPGAAAGGGWPR